MTRETALVTRARRVSASSWPGCLRRIHRTLCWSREKTGTGEPGGRSAARHGVQVHVLAADLADPAAPPLIHEQLTTRGIAIDVLVNNAGFGLEGRFADLPAQQQIDMAQVNVTCSHAPDTAVLAFDD